MLGDYLQRQPKWGEVDCLLDLTVQQLGLHSPLTHGLSGFQAIRLINGFHEVLIEKEIETPGNQGLTSCKYNTYSISYNTGFGV